MGVANEWNLWVWLECIGVVSGCCCMQVYRYPHNIIITYISLYSTCISSFFDSSIPTSLFIFKRFMFLLMLTLYNIASVAQRTFEFVQKSRARVLVDIIIIIIYIDKHVS